MTLELAQGLFALAVFAWATCVALAHARLAARVKAIEQSRARAAQSPELRSILRAGRFVDALLDKRQDGAPPPDQFYRREGRRFIPIGKPE